MLGRDKRRGDRGLCRLPWRVMTGRASSVRACRPVLRPSFCVVVGIGDGDTLTAHCDSAADKSAQTVKVRLAEVDAPEHQQAFGTRSRKQLASLCFKQSAEVRPIAPGGGLDRYGRTVAHVSCNGVDANTEQVRAGMAWVFDRYVIDRGWRASGRTLGMAQGCAVVRTGDTCFPIRLLRNVERTSGPDSNGSRRVSLAPLETRSH